MHQIKPHLLWVGHAGDGRNFQEIFDNRIRAIVQLALEEPPIQPPRDLVFCRIPLIDGTGNDPVLLNLAIDTVAALQRSRISTLVCCGGGMSRSPAIAAAALSAVEHKPLEECLRIVAESRPHDVLPGLWAEVRYASGEDQGE